MNLINKAHHLLSKGEVSDAIYVNNCLDEVLKIPNLNKQEQDLLSVFFLKLLDRLCGEETTTAPEAAVGVLTTGISTWSKGALGGWIKALCQQQSPASSSVLCVTVDNLLHPGAKLLKHILPNRPLFAILSKSGYELRFSLLPPKMQMLLSGHVFYRLFTSSSHLRVLQQLLKTPVVIGREASAYNYTLS
jgi:hypothetical protein